MTFKPKTPSQIESMRIGGKILAEGLALVESKAEAGVSTAVLNVYIEEFFEKHKVKPAFLGYQGFPASICISLNDEVVHGIPKQDTILQEGDILDIDSGLIYDGMYLDSGYTFGVGRISEDARLLIERTKKSFYKGVAKVKAGSTIGDYGYEVEKYLSQFGYGIIRDYAGHGVGLGLHEEPLIPNYGRKGEGARFVEGMTVCFEPMVTLGSEEIYHDIDDGWTVITEDGSLSAHYEHTVLITKNGVELLTQL
jgi:methionyl aminopeptidase